ncbi:hypothetical protein HMPREF1586_00126, partial [Gardnerella vaginalis JCP8522]
KTFARLDRANNYLHENLKRSTRQVIAKTHYMKPQIFRIL